MSAARARLVSALLLGLAAFALYSRSLGSGFVYDAEAPIEHGSYIHTRSHLADAWAGAAIALQHLGRISDARATLRKAAGVDPRYGHPRELIEAMVASEKDAAAIEEILQSPPP